MKNTVAIIPKRLTHGDELVVLPKIVYEDIQKRLLESQDALAKILRGEDELRRGKTRIVSSLRDIE